MQGLDLALDKEHLTDACNVPQRQVLFDFHFTDEECETEGFGVEEVGFRCCVSHPAGLPILEQRCPFLPPPQPPPLQPAILTNLN